MKRLCFVDTLGIYRFLFFAILALSAFRSAADFSNAFCVMPAFSRLPDPAGYLPAIPHLCRVPAFCASRSIPRNRLSSLWPNRDTKVSSKPCQSV
jgi:hypothetical protein